MISSGLLPAFPGDLLCSFFHILYLLGKGTRCYPFSMKIPMYQVDAFTDRTFGGNPAAICVLRDWLPTETMQAIAVENNLSETAFLVPDGKDFLIRWFTPAAEIDLAGHPTLASAYVVFQYLHPGRTSVNFRFSGGLLSASQDGRLISMDFPSRPPKPAEPIPGIADALGATPSELLRSRDVLAVFPDEAAVRALNPDFRGLKALGFHGCIVSAPGDSCDFVSRFFAPVMGIDEDPVTGSAHCTLVPYWAARLGKAELHARQISRRGGELWCEDRGERVSLSGAAAPYLEGWITIDAAAGTGRELQS
jgi:PhzF family phenazine biosynthesis protein